MFITAQGGQIEVSKVKHEDGKKTTPAEFAAAFGVAKGALFGS
jgi:methionyl-tRNA formyltransferase